MKCKMLLFDLDGTLLRTDKTISKFTMQELEKWLTTAREDVKKQKTQDSDEKNLQTVEGVKKRGRGMPLGSENKKTLDHESHFCNKSQWCD